MHENFGQKKKKKPTRLSSVDELSGSFFDTFNFCCCCRLPNGQNLQSQENVSRTWWNDDHYESNILLSMETLTYSKTAIETLKGVIFGTKYSRMDQVKFVEGNL